VLDIGTLDEFAKLMCEVHLKPQGEDLECFCGDTCKMKVSGDYKTLWQRFWMYNNLAYDPEQGDMEVPYDRLCYPLSTFVLNDLFNMLNA
jgi:hypothetical protein